MFCKSGEAETEGKRVSVKVREGNKGKRRLLGPSSKRKVEFTLSKKKLAE